MKPLVARREPLSAEAKPPVDSTQPTDSSKLKSKKSKSKSKAKSAQPTVHDISCCIVRLCGFVVDEFFPEFVKVVAVHKMIMTLKMHTALVDIHN